MYFNQTIKRINQINWTDFGKKEVDCNNNLLYEYLRRIAQFFKENFIKAKNPLYTNIARELGYHEDVCIFDYCGEEANQVLKIKQLPKHMLECYLQLSKYADIIPEKDQYLEIYEPMVRIIENGVSFGYREGGFMPYNGNIFMPLNNWYERFLNAEPKKIDV